MNSDKNQPTSSNAKEISFNRSNISEVKLTKHRPNKIEGYYISKDNNSSFKKILVTDDGKEIYRIKQLIMLSLYLIPMEQNEILNEINNNIYDLVVMC